MLMTKAELVAAMAEKANLNRAQAKDALEAFINSVTSSLKQGQDVRLVGFGTFRAVQRPAGTARSSRESMRVRCSRTSKHARSWSYARNAWFSGSNGLSGITVAS